MESYEEANRRALNAVWNAAEDYHVNPVFLSCTVHEDTDFYLNTIVGLVHKWYDEGPLLELFRSFEGSAFQVQYDTLALIALENAAFEKEKKYRPVLPELRRAYAVEGLQISRGRTKEQMYEIILDGHFHRILNERFFLPKREQALLDALSFEPDMTSSEMKLKLQSLLSVYFRSHITDGGTKDTIRVTLPHFMKWIPSGHTVLRNPGYHDKDADTEETGGRQSEKKHFFGARAREEEDELVRQKLVEYFGASLFGRKENAAIDRMLCTGSHKGCHLLYTDGQRSSAAADANIPHSLYEDSTQIRVQRQEQRNLDFYSEYHGKFQSAVTRLYEKIMNVLLTEQTDEIYRSKNGILDSARVWRSIAFREEKVFLKKEILNSGNLCVTLLLDASASQINRQEIIAAEAYIIAEALRLCEIPTQIFSYCSTGGYTVLNRLKERRETAENSARENRRIFRYAAVGWNRDGLALRGITKMIDRKKYKNNLLLMLTDSAPNDERRIPSSDSPIRSKAYTTAEGIRDTAVEVRSLRKDGVRVAGIFYGSDMDWPSAGQIFGEDVARIGDIADLAASAGEFIQSEIGRVSAS